MATLRQQMRFHNRLSGIFLSGCILAIAAIVSPQDALANNLIICKRTIPSPDTTGTFFTFTGANGWPTPPNSFNALYLSNQTSFNLQDSTSNPTQCRTFNITGHDQFNKITETAPPPGWTLTNVSCSHVTSVVNIAGATVTIDQNEPNVTCTFVNSCAFKAQDLSTGVANWLVTKPNGTVVLASATATYAGWAAHAPPAVGGPAFPPGTRWIQPVNSPVAVNQPSGTYTYRLRFSIPCPGKVDGWFAADNAAVLEFDGNPATTVNCLGNPSFCFQQANVTNFSQAVGAGGHVIKFTVTNQAGGPSRTGLLAHITVQ